MKRIIFDTSVYGELVIDHNSVSKIEKLIEAKKVLIYGNKVIRDELREVSAKSKLGRYSKRILLLSLYDKLVSGHEIKIGDITKILSEKYYEEYKKLGGAEPFQDMEDDFVIIASASLKELDIVVSHDTKTMISGLAVSAYKKINLANGLRSPNFIPYAEYKKKLNFIDPPI